MSGTEEPSSSKAWGPSVERTGTLVVEKSTATELVKETTKGDMWTQELLPGRGSHAKATGRPASGHNES
jgi:hypothetical protein